jgi:hypothetical protein
MNNNEACRYRGYQIVPRRHWSQWGVSVYTLNADLPILSSSTLRELMPEREAAIAAARRQIDRLLARTF